MDQRAVTDLLRAMVVVPSANPGMDPSSTGEGAAGAALARWAHGEGLHVTLQEVEPGRNNVLLDLGLNHLPTLAFITHLDTVPDGDLTDRAAAVSVENGRMYGRGACDAKASLAAMVAALHTLRARAGELRVNVQVAAMVDEEHTFLGVLEYVRRLDPARPVVAAVVGEPTRLEVVIAHMGVLRFRLHTIGRSANSSRPENGVNAVDKMMDVLSELRSAFVREALPPHPLTGRVEMTVVKIEGGIAPNVVPAFCTAMIDRRLAPGETAGAALAWLESHLAKLRARDLTLDVELETPFVRDEALQTDAGSPLVGAVLEARAAVCGASVPIGVPFGTDGSKVSALGGIPTVVFGPGDIAQAHTSDEWVEIGQIMQAAEIYTRLALAIKPPL